MSSTKLKLLIPEDADGERLDRFLARSLPQYSREYLKRLIQEGCVQLNEKPISKPSHSLSEGAELLLEVPEPIPMALPAEDIELDVEYEDDDLLVVYKPSGMLTHPTPREQTGTLVNALLHHCKGDLSGINGVERPGIVHRLDRQTSGLLMIAKSDTVHRDLQRQIQERSIDRFYRTIVQGLMPKQAGMIHAPIGRNPSNRDKMAINYDGRQAITHWELLEPIGNKFSILRVKLETGRTHQIRVHMAHINHPVFADPLYGTGLEKVIHYPSEGQILQAYRLGFIHPISGEKLRFDRPPDDKFIGAEAFLKTWIQKNG